MYPGLLKMIPDHKQDVGLDLLPIGGAQIGEVLDAKRDRRGAQRIQPYLGRWLRKYLGMPFERLRDERVGLMYVILLMNADHERQKDQRHACDSDVDAIAAYQLMDYMQQSAEKAVPVEAAGDSQFFLPAGRARR
jgi:hypothetical protein